MSQPPPLPPYGQPPAGMSNKAKFWIGVAASLPAMAAAAVVVGGGTALADSFGGSSDLTGLFSLLFSLLVLGGFVTMISLEQTRWFAIGILAGAAVAFILAAGACVVLLAGINNSYG